MVQATQANRYNDDWTVPETKGAYRSLSVGGGASGERPGDMFRCGDEQNSSMAQTNDKRSSETRSNQNLKTTSESKGFKW